MKTSSTTFEFKNLLKILNGIIFVLLIFGYPLSYDHPYINEITIFLGCALILQTHIALSIKRNSSDPFVILLLYYITVYYSFRIVTLAYFVHSDVLSRFPYDPSDTNYALVFIILSNFCMLIGFGARNIKIGQLTDFNKANTNPHKIIIPWTIFICLSFFAQFTGLYEHAANYSRISAIFINYLGPSLLFFPFIVFFIVHTKKVSFIVHIEKVFFIVFKKKINKYSFYLLFLLVLILTMHSMIINGTRGDIVYLIELLLIIFLAKEKFTLKRKHTYRVFFLTPILVIILIVVYNIASMQRNFNTEDGMAKFTFLKDNFFQSFQGDASVERFAIDRILSRVGFLDFSAGIIAHEHEYENIFNITNYYQSIVDNVLTPGFDVYDTPKISKSLIFDYENMNNRVLSKSFSEKNVLYNTDQIGIYGEMYALFGWSSLILFLFGSYFIKRIYYLKKYNADNYEVVLKRTLILFFSVRIFNSFGMDWSLIEIIPYIVVCYISLIFTKILSNRKRYVVNIQS